MTKEVIDKYIQFAIDNWYDEYDMEWYLFMETLKWPRHYVNVITSKEFIEAVARWLMENIWFYDLDKIINVLTKDQAIAIRDWKLEEFILELIK